MNTVFKTFMRGGPVGLVHTLREAWLARRIRHISNLMDRERALHRMHVAQLRAELDALALRQVASTHRAAQYWRALS